MKPSPDHIMYCALQDIASGECADPQITAASALLAVAAYDADEAEEQRISAASK
jgi:hypothetical protein